MVNVDEVPGFSQVRAAAARIAPYAHRTPVLTCAALDALAGTRTFFKCESFQKVGAFKFRGACNAVLSLGEREARRGVATHSSGNHAAALALAARLRGIPAYVVMPRTALTVKRAAVTGYGAEVTLCAPTLAARERALAEVVARTGANVVHPYNDARVIAGAGTAALELVDEVGELDAIIAPVGGGGLLSGTALAMAAMTPRAVVLGAEPAGADDACRSLASGRIEPSLDPHTIADGLLTSLGDLTFAIIRRHVDRILTVSETSIVESMRLVWERMKLVIEPSAAVAVAALLLRPQAVEGRRVGVILSGGNADLEALPWG
jgi:threonine dehydratase